MTQKTERIRRKKNQKKKLKSGLIFKVLEGNRRGSKHKQETWKTLRGVEEGF
jgi:hypothetical protein